MTSFTQQPDNPFGLTKLASDSAPTFADIDGDGDLDAFIGARDGNTNFFLNTGTNRSPIFAVAQPNPFGLSNVGNYSTPTFADIDGGWGFRCLHWGKGRQYQFLPEHHPHSQPQPCQPQPE